jgi:hypothetical protein
MRAAQSIGGTLLALAAYTTVQSASAGRFGWLGLAPAEAGQTLQQAEFALGTPLQPAAPAAKDAARCQLRSASSQAAVAYVVDQGLIRRMESRDPRHATMRGVHVGDEVKRVRQVYGQRLSARLPTSNEG